MTSRARKAETIIGMRDDVITGAQETVADAAQAAGFDAALTSGSITRLFSWPVEAWLHCQAEILKAAEPVTSGWLGRRKEAANAALETLEKLTQCNDLNEAVSIHRDWLDGAMRRLESDMHALADHAVAVSHEAMTVTRHMTQSSSEMVGLNTPAFARPVERVDQAA